MKYLLVVVLLATLLVINRPSKAQNATVEAFKVVEVAQASSMPDICGLAVVVCPEEDFRLIIEEEAKEHGVDPNVMLDLAECESASGKMMVGDTNMPKPSYGLFQINLYYHPDITKEQAMDYRWSADWTAKMIAKGYLHRWTCGRKI